jgi:glycosyltransferase involved in cell wall biosynthesis
MRILLIGNYAPDRQESMLRYAALLEHELRARGHTVHLLQPKAVLGGRSKWFGYIDKFVLFPSALRKALTGIDVVHICDHSNAMYTRHLRSTPNVVTCHDVLAIASALGEVPHNPVSATGRALQGMILKGLKAAQYVVCVSSITRAEMLRVTGRPAETSSVVLSGLSYPYSPMPREEALARMDALGYDARKPFFLHVGGAAWYKNRLGLLRLFNQLRKQPGLRAARLLMVGGAFDYELQHYLYRQGYEWDVTRLSNLPNEDLRAAYSLAEAFLFPSLQEGFGWPVLEAQACGCPVFATNRAPMTEVGGDAAVYFDPADLQAAARIIRVALEDRESLCQAGLANAARFTVERMIEGYLQAYEHVTARRQ